ncbi:carbohydrate ABC transporter permease [Saccharomonospora sp. NPDC046836]|uniref:carbohydrate ABC transporter permease n=1 Tax=Saccharomonospora sp. NPDC046836 TaxID=3156921 RepID=UPI0033F57579
MTVVERRKRASRVDYRRVGLWIALAISLLVWTAPILFMVFTSLKTEAEIYTTPTFLPPLDPQWENFASAFERGGMLQAGSNSLIIALIKVPLGLVFSAMAAFALSRLRFRFQGTLLAVIALGAMVPVQVAIAPLFQTILNLGLLNTHLGVILPYIAFGMPYQVFILYGFFSAIPRELDESARLDGAGNMRLFFSIVLPLAKPALAALFILDFVSTWNEYGMALVLLQDRESWTVPLAVQAFQSEMTSAFGPLNAFTIMSVLPVVIIYLLFQRYFVRGALAGAVKG